MPKFIQKYQCLFCGDLFNYELPAIEHEKECSYNPEAKKCGTCRYLVSEYGNNICRFSPEDGSSTYEFYDDSLTCPYHELEIKEKNDFKTI